MQQNTTTFHIETGEGVRVRELGSCTFTEADRAYVQFLGRLAEPEVSYRLVETTTIREVVNV